jgi:hypothetical protein
MGGGKLCSVFYSTESMDMHRHTSTSLRPEGELQVSYGQGSLQIKDANGDYLYLSLNCQQRQAVLEVLQANA